MRAVKRFTRKIRMKKKVEWNWPGLRRPVESSGSGYGLSMPLSISMANDVEFFERRCSESTDFSPLFEDFTDGGNIKDEDRRGRPGGETGEKTRTRRAYFEDIQGAFAASTLLTRFDKTLSVLSVSLFLLGFSFYFHSRILVPSERPRFVRFLGAPERRRRAGVTVILSYPARSLSGGQ